MVIMTIMMIMIMLMINMMMKGDLNNDDEYDYVDDEDDQVEFALNLIDNQLALPSYNVGPIIFVWLLLGF